MLIFAVDVLVLGLANLVADGISMGFGDFVSTSTEKEVAAKERQVTEWDVINRQRPQQRELLRQYQAMGMNVEDATMVLMCPISCPHIHTYTHVHAHAQSIYNIVL